MPSRCLAVLAVIVSLVVLPAASSSAPLLFPVPVGPGWTWVHQAAPLELGVTYTQDGPSRAEPDYLRALPILRSSGRWQGQHLMGFGALNPEPAPGVYDWSTLDDRMAVARASGGSTVLTAAVAPDWMKGGRVGETDWTQVEVAPRPEHYDDFAALTARAVARYPQIRAVLVWNELKGFFDADRNAWNSAGYVDLYDRVYRAVKQVRPDVLVGGPYIPLDAWSTADAGGAPSDLRGPWGVADQRSLDVVSTWLATNAGADFVAVDGGAGTKDAGLITSPVQGAEKFAALSRWVRDRTDLPLWWAEFYPETGTDDGPASAARASVTLQAVAAMARAGVATALLWGPEAGPSLPYASLWTDTGSAGGSRPTALTAAWTWLVPRLSRGDVEIGYSPDGSLLVLRASDGLLAVNTTADPVEIARTGVVLTAHGTALLPLSSVTP